MTNVSLPKVAFVCTHNSCRSQIAEALAKSIAADAFDVYSAGTHPAPAVNDTALRLLEQRSIDTSGLYPKTLPEIPSVDYVITMGCGVACPTLACKHREDWGLEDPSGKDDATFLECMATIERNILELKDVILSSSRSDDERA